MNTIDLAKLLIEKLGWNTAVLAEKCGISRPVTHRMLNSPIKTERRDGFHVGVIAAALEHGFEAEALAVLLGKEPAANSSSTLRAAILYPDLKPNELQLLLDMEVTTHLSPLPIEVIKAVVTHSRENKP